MPTAQSQHTLQPSQSFLTLLLTFIPLDCPIFPLRNISNTGLLRKLLMAVPKRCHVDARNEEFVV